MTAKNMFEKLGFRSQVDDDYINWISTSDDGFVREIAFDYNRHSIEFYYHEEGVFGEYSYVGLSLEELFAIIEQASKLGWMDTVIDMGVNDIKITPTIISLMNKETSKDLLNILENEV